MARLGPHEILLAAAAISCLLAEAAEVLIHCAEEAVTSLKASSTPHVAFVSVSPITS